VNDVPAIVMYDTAKIRRQLLHTTKLSVVRAVLCILHLAQIVSLPALHVLRR